VVNDEQGGVTALSGGAENEIQAAREGANGIQVINRAARVLRALRNEPAGLSLAQIAVKVGLPRSTVQRIVGALVNEHLLMHAAPSGRVKLGPEILNLAAGSTFDIIEFAHPHLKALSEETGETVDLAVLRGDHLVFVDQVVGSHRLRAVSAVGEIFPLHSTANGKACLALFDEVEIRLRFGPTLERACRADGRPFRALLDEIARVRRTGVAVDEGEHSEGISALGTAFFDPGGVAYAVSIPLPTSRFSENRKALSAALLAVRNRLVDLAAG
jgi:DNA-binding IclR family transcriptional regulator